MGILLDSNLSWKSHTDMLVLKISTLIGVLHRVKKYFPKSILLTIYKSLITPHLNYGLLLWGNRRSRVNISQKKAIRVVNFSPYIHVSHSEPIFKNLKLHNTLPTYFNSYRQFFIKKPLLTIYVIMLCHCRELIMCLQKKVLCTNLLNYIIKPLMIH